MLVAISIYWTPLVTAVVQPFSECRFPISAIKNLRTLEEKAELKGTGPQSSFPSGAAAEIKLNRFFDLTRGILDNFFLIPKTKQI